MRRSLLETAMARLKERPGGVVRWLGLGALPVAVPLLIWLVWSEPRPVWLLWVAGALLLFGLMDPFLPSHAEQREVELRLRADKADRARIRRRPDGAIDWAAMDYFEVSVTDRLEGPRTLEGLMNGPLKRLFDICEEDSGVRLRARAMEFAPGPVARFKHRHARSERAAAEVDAVVMAELQRRFGPRGSDGRYMIDCYLGKRTHNG